MWKVCVYTDPVATWLNPMFASAVTTCG